MKICGVYLIKSPSGRKYIGSSVDIDSRALQYRCYNCKKQRLLYNSLIKYGYKHHQFIILTECNPEDRLKKERELGDLHMVMYMYGGLNLELPGYEDVPGITSIETRKKRSDSMKKTLSTNEMRQFISDRQKKKVINTDTGDIYIGVAEAAIKVGIPKQHLTQMLNGRKPNFTSFIYEGSAIPINQKDKRLKVVIDTKTGKEFSRIREASDFLNMKRDRLKGMLGGRSKNTTTMIYKV